MGVVYLAREVRLDRWVALKVLPPHLAVHEELRDRFLREARTAARLSHPNIIPIFAVDEVDDVVFFSMAYIEGGTLGQRVRERGPLPPAETARILREVAWALAYAHAQGVVHRDVKPDNILLEVDTGRALVADFGIARIRQSSSLTGSGEIVGTPEFMSPEQASGGEVDARSDLYSLGAVGYFAVSGKVPFEGPTVQSILAQHITAAVPDLVTAAPETPRPLARTIEQCLAKDPSARFASGEELVEALERSLGGERRDLPVPIRLWLISGERLKLGYTITVAILWSMMMVAYVSMMTLNPHSMSVAQWTGFFFLAFAVPAILVPVLGVLRTISTRRLLAEGYRLDDVRLALRLRLSQRREELSYQVRRRSSPIARLVRWINRAALAGFVGSAVLLFTVSDLDEAGILVRVLGWSLVLLLGSGIASTIFPSRPAARDWAAELGMKFWNGLGGRWFMKLAGLGLAKQTRATQFTHRPTELAIASAADALFEALPRETRNELRDLPDVIRQLESNAEAIRKRVYQLTEMLADAGAAKDGPKSSALQRAEPELGDRRQTLLHDLRTARDEAEKRLSTAVAALETIRLDLLRLSGGVGNLAAITADVNAAREVGDQIDRLLSQRVKE